MAINTYSPSDVDLLISGFKITAWESISIRRDNESYTFVKGIRGKNTRVRNYNKSASIELTVLQTSEVHDVLTEIHRRDAFVEENADLARLTIVLKDRSGTSAFQSEDAYITGLPDMKFSQDFDTRVWKIQCHTINIFKVGGNIRPTTNLIDSIFNTI